jgi:O-antigen/teichoic acid export membrane protein
MTARFLGTERFGLWLLLGSFLTWGGLVDLGLGNSLTTEVARADGRDDRKVPRVLVSSAFFPVLAIAVAVSVFFAIVYSWIPWPRVMNVTGTVAASEAGAAVAVTAIVFVARLPLGIASRLYSAYQEGYRYQLWSGSAVALSIVLLKAAIAYNASLPTLLASFFGTMLLGDVAASVDIFARRRRWLAPRLRYFDMRIARSLLSTGLMFWIAQIASILLLQTDLVLVARLFGAEAVADYGVALRLFSVVSMVQMAFASSLWPAYAEALERKDQAWVSRTFFRSIVLATAWAVLASLLLVACGGAVVRLLINGRDTPSQGLLAAMATTAVVSAIAQSFAMLLNGLGEIRIQAWLGFLSGVFNIAVSLVLGYLIGPAGVSLGTAFAILASVAVSAGFLRRKVGTLKAKPGFATKGAT